MMACCTISPLNSPQKRNSSGIFDLPKSAKRRRPFSSTNLTTLSTSSTSSTMFTTTSNNKPVIVDSKNNNSTSVFNTSVPYSPLSSLNPTSSTIGDTESNLRNELMERIKYEAKRLNKRRQMNLSSITTTSSITPCTNSDHNNASSSDDDDQENNKIINNQQNKLQILLNEMNNKKKLSCTLNTSSNTKNSDSKISINNVNLIKTSDNILNSSSASSSSSLSSLTTTTTTTTTTSATTSSTLSKPVNKKLDLIFQNSTYNDLPIFSMNQVNQICERMLKERELTLREQYDKILSQKLNEQYDSFVRFTHEQIQRRFENSQCSYVS